MTIHVLGGRMAVADYRACRALLENCVPGSPLERLIHRKLLEAAPRDDRDVDPAVVTINSRVEYQVGGEAPQKRILVRCAFRNGLVGLTLPISTPRGMALLGLRTGQSFAFEEGGRERVITVLRVHYQPQAARQRPGIGARLQAAPGEVIDLARIREAAAPADRRPGDRRRGT